MEGTPPEVSLPEIKRTLEELHEVSDVHNIHAWALTSGKHVFSAHLRVTEQADQEEVLQTAYDMLRKDFGFFFATLQIETRCFDESGAEAIDLSAASSKTGHNGDL